VLNIELATLQELTSGILVSREFNRTRGDATNRMVLEILRDATARHLAAESGMGKDTPLSARGLYLEYKSRRSSLPPAESQHEKLAGSGRLLISKLNDRLNDYYRGGGAGRQRLRILSRPYLLDLSLSHAPQTADAVHADPREVARLLRAFVKLRGFDNDECERRFQEFQSKISARNPGVPFLKQTFQRYLAALDRSQAAAESDWVRSLAEKFDIPPLLLHPLFATREPGPLLSLDFDGDFFLGGDVFTSVHTQTDLGEHTTYRTAKKRIEGADAAIVHLELHKNGRSAPHSHPGDEMVLVRKGAVVVRFPHTGVDITLNAGDLVHFYAEHLHAVEVVENKAELFIVRFYQLEARGTRQAIRDNVMASFSSGKRLSPDSHEAAWIQEMLPHYSPDVSSIGAGPGPLHWDRLGLARFVERCAFKPKRASKPARALHHAVLSASSQFGRAVTPEGIAALYGCPQFMIANFAAPAAPSPIVIRDGDWIPSADGNYLRPNKNLSCSDISLARVHLPKDYKTTPHDHPGLELMLIEDGELELTVLDRKGRPEQTEKLSTAHNQLCHFRSNAKHFAETPRHQDARFFVIRFFRDGAVTPPPKKKAHVGKAAKRSSGKKKTAPVIFRPPVRRDGL
jgi:quercetin dioxygenase-like cupin family protein